MIDHVEIRVSDRAASERFYDTVLPVLGLEKSSTEEWTEWAGAAWSDFSVSEARPDRPVTLRLHVAFAAASRDLVDAFWRAGTAAGYESDGEPGLRPEYDEDYYGAFLLDPDGNSVEAVHHGRSRPGCFDHVWIRVADVPAARRFYELVAPFGGYALDHERDGFAHFIGPDASFSLVRGEPTENLHLAFGTGDDGVVRAFLAAALEAGHRDNGGPGERPEYHAGYYGAFVLDPDGNNVEVVNHNR